MYSVPVVLAKKVSSLQEMMELYQTWMARGSQRHDTKARLGDGKEGAISRSGSSVVDFGELGQNDR